MDIRSRIIEVSSRMFLANGLKTITMDNIAQALGVSKRTLYEHFADKEQLLNEVVDSYLRISRIEQDALIHSNTNCIEIYLQFYSLLKTGLDAINRNYFRELKRYYPSIYKKFDDASEERICDQIRLLEEGKRIGLIRAEVNSEIASQLIRLQFDVLIHFDMYQLKQYTINELMGTIILNFVRGIATVEGIRIIDEYIENTKI